MRIAPAFVAALIGSATFFPVVAVAEELKNTIASEVSTGTSGSDGARVSKTSDWTVYTVPANYVINKDKTSVNIISERGSEHTYKVDYADFVEIIAGTGIKQPTTIKVQTHARSSKGPKGGGGGMKISVDVYYVKYK
jgi:hypothetical protein